MIEFLCPNGHRIRCQAEQAGRAAKCPRCGVKFRVPGPTDLNVSEAIGSDSNIVRPDFTDSDVGSKKGMTVAGGSKKEPQIEFLCPNGHRLHGSSNLQGKPGQCPECGSRFRIPTYEEISAEEEAASSIRLGYAEGNETSGSTPRLPLEDLGMPTTISGRSDARQEMAELIIRLWEARPIDVPLEIRLRGGDTLMPTEFLREISQQTHQGVFTISESDGTVSLIAIAWDAIEQATLRGLKQIPKDLTDE